MKQASVFRTQQKSSYSFRSEIKRDSLPRKKEICVRAYGNAREAQRKSGGQWLTSVSLNPVPNVVISFMGLTGTAQTVRSVFA
jgi:hypothetical protein